MKSAKDLVQAEYPALKLNFLAVEEDELEDTQKITNPIREAVEQGPEDANVSKAS